MYTYTAVTALASLVCYYNHLHPLPQMLLRKQETKIRDKIETVYISLAQ